MKHYNKLKNRPQMVSISKLYLNFSKEIIVCLRVAHPKSEESSHDIRYIKQR